MESGNERIHDECLREQITRAQATALPGEEWNKILHEEAELSNLFLHGKINGEELKQKLRILNRHAGVVKAETPEEFRRILELVGLAEEVIQRFIHDEVPHYEEARAQGVKPLLRVQFFKIGDENWGVHAQTEVMYSAALSDELFREAHRRTLAAPGEENLGLLDRKGLGLE